VKIVNFKTKEAVETHTTKNTIRLAKETI